MLRPTTPAGIGSRTQRERIVDAILESCAEKTYAATTITDIVARARISRTTFYKHFNDKRACFDAAVEYCIAELQAAAAAAHSSEDAPATATRKAATAVIEALAERPGLAQLLSGDAIAVDPAVIERYRRVTIPALEALWREGGSLRVGPESAGADPGPVRVVCPERARGRALRRRLGRGPLRRPALGRTARRHLKRPQ